MAGARPRARKARVHDRPGGFERPGTLSIDDQMGRVEGGAPPSEARFRRSHPIRALVIMTVPFVFLIALAAIPLVGFVILLVLMPIEMGRIGGRRIARGDAMWVAMPAALVVGTMELAVILTILSSIPGVSVVVDVLGLLTILLIYGCNGFFFSVGALSTAFDPNEPFEAEPAERSSA